MSYRSNYKEIVARSWLLLAGLVGLRKKMILEKKKPREKRKKKKIGKRKTPKTCFGKVKFVIIRRIIRIIPKYQFEFDKREKSIEIINDLVVLKKKNSVLYQIRCPKGFEISQFFQPNQIFFFFFFFKDSGSFKGLDWHKFVELHRSHLKLIDFEE